jgi:hypothetical protein
MAAAGRAKIVGDHPAGSQRGNAEGVFAQLSSPLVLWERVVAIGIME